MKIGNERDKGQRLGKGRKREGQIKGEKLRRMLWKEIIKEQEIGKKKRKSKRLSNDESSKTKLAKYKE